MAIDFDNFPVYDPIIPGKHLSHTWLLSFTTFIQTLSDYLKESGIRVPILTTVQRDSLQNPIDGQIIYNSDSNSIETFNGTWGIFMPQLTTTQKNAIVSPRNGQLVYDITLNKAQVWQVNTWANIA